MEKKLPGIFANKIEKGINNNSNVYYSANKEKDIEVAEQRTSNNKINPELNVNQKINRIFSSTKYVYKADVNIKMKNEELDCRIIGKNSTHLITIDNKLIPISDIIDINFLEK